MDPLVTVIPEGAFRTRRELEQIDLPEGLVRIGDKAFSNCGSLRIINIPSTVTEIGNCAFDHCRKLDRAVLPEGLQTLGYYAFRCCTSLQRINIPSNIETIEEGAFMTCDSLSEVLFPEGLREMKEDAFYNCKSLIKVILPASLRSIGVEAFEFCSKLNEVHIPDNLWRISERAFMYCNITNFRFSPLIGNVIDVSIVGSITSLVSLELSENVAWLEDNHDDNDPFTDINVRNIALPSGCDTTAIWCLGDFDDLGVAFPEIYGGDEGRNIRPALDALMHRFDNLPIHKICYYQSYHDTEITLQHLQREINTSKISGQINTTGKQQDRLGMTPLHILACSTMQNTQMYSLLINKYPETLMIKDKWGDVPLLYAIWCNSPSEVIELLVESYKSLHPDFEFDWSGMILTLAKRYVPLANIQRLVNTQQNSFPEQEYDMQQVVMELASSVKVIETLRYLLRISITERLESLDISKWNIDLENCIKLLPDVDDETNDRDREEETQAVYNRLATYESIKEGTSVLELALWKAKIDTNRNKKAKIDGDVSYRDQCRINCRADIIIRNVLPYLLPK